MRCRNALRFSGPYMDGELPADLHAEVERHLAGCEGCGKHLERLRALERMILEAPVHPFPDTLLPGILRGAGASLRSRGPGRTIPLRAARWAAAALLVLGIALGSLMGIAALRVRGETGAPPGPGNREETVLDFYTEAFGAAPRGSLADTFLDLNTPRESGRRDA